MIWFKLWTICLFMMMANCDAASFEGDVRESTRTECNLPEDIIQDIASYAGDVAKIIEYFTTEFKNKTYDSVADFVDKFGNRLTGSQSLEDSIDYMVNLSKEHELENVHTEEMPVKLWDRQEESAEIVSPRRIKMPMLGLGNSVGTSSRGIQAPVVVVETFEELDGLSDDKVKGKIVVFDPKFTTYGQTVRFRNSGAVAAARRGAIAALIRSISQISIATPHTGVQDYADGVTKIPTAAITHEDADYMRRQQNRGIEVVVNLKMNPWTEMKTSRNMAADLEGSEMPQKVVIISGHIDSWDVGDGSMDDAGGSFISWLAPVVLKKMNMRPKRTLRAVLFTAEEQGLFGAIEYEQQNRRWADDLVFLMESDSGTFAPLGLNYQGSDEGECVMREILKLFTLINATELVLLTPAAPDISVWTNKGFPGVGLHNANDRYFWFHHTAGDALNVIDKEVMDLNGAFWTSVAYIISDMKYEIPKSSGFLIYSTNVLYYNFIALVFLIRYSSSYQYN